MDSLVIRHSLDIENEARFAIRRVADRPIFAGAFFGSWRAEGRRSLFLPRMPDSPGASEDRVFPVSEDGFGKDLNELEQTGGTVIRVFVAGSREYHSGSPRCPVKIYLSKNAMFYRQASVSPAPLAVTYFTILKSSAASVAPREAFVSAEG